MSSHFETIPHAVRPDLIFMMREDSANEDVVDGDENGYADPRNAPVQADSSDVDFVCAPCDPDLLQDDEGECAQVPKGVPEPKPPSAEAQRRHNLTHWPYASWCPHCVMARRNNSSHPQAPKGAERTVPLLVLDYRFIRNVADQDLVTLLVGKLYPLASWI